MLGYIHVGTFFIATSLVGGEGRGKERREERKGEGGHA